VAELATVCEGCKTRVVCDQTRGDKDILYKTGGRLRGARACGLTDRRHDTEMYRPLVGPGKLTRNRGIRRGSRRVTRSQRGGGCGMHNLRGDKGGAANEAPRKGSGRVLKGLLAAICLGACLGMAKAK
jgi:hypothetical protein